jgi:hypothetical protein
MGYRQGTAVALWNLTMVALLQGQHDSARGYAQELLAYGQAHHMPERVAVGHWLLGVIAHLAGNQPTAHDHGEALLAHGQVYPNSGGSALGHWLLGLLALTAKDLDAARAQVRDALARARDRGVPGGPAMVITTMAVQLAAALAAAQGQADRALRLVGATSHWYANRTRVSSNRRFRRLVLDQWLAPARGQLSEAAQAAAEAAGQAMTLEQAIAYALEEGGEDTGA